MKPNNPPKSHKSSRYFLNTGPTQCEKDRINQVILALNRAKKTAQEPALVAELSSAFVTLRSLVRGRSD